MDKLVIKGIPTNSLTSPQNSSGAGMNDTFGSVQSATNGSFDMDIYSSKTSDDLFGAGRYQLEREKRLRREIANSNERRRMQSINAGFNNLRNLIPTRHKEKMSKASILQQTADYIRFLEEEKSILIKRNNQLESFIKSLNQTTNTAAGTTTLSVNQVAATQLLSGVSGNANNANNNTANNNNGVGTSNLAAGNQQQQLTIQQQQGQGGVGSTGAATIQFLRSNSTPQQIIIKSAHGAPLTGQQIMKIIPAQRANNLTPGIKNAAVIRTGATIGTVNNAAITPTSLLTSTTNGGTNVVDDGTTQGSNSTQQLKKRIKMLNGPVYRNFAPQPVTLVSSGGTANNPNQQTSPSSLATGGHQLLTEIQEGVTDDHQQQQQQQTFQQLSQTPAQAQQNQQASSLIMTAAGNLLNGTSNNQTILIGNNSGSTVGSTNLASAPTSSVSPNVIVLKNSLSLPTTPLALATSTGTSPAGLTAIRLIASQLTPGLSANNVALSSAGSGASAVLSPTANNGNGNVVIMNSGDISTSAGVSIVNTSDGAAITVNSTGDEGRRNLQTIVEAIKHLEGDSLYSIMSTSNQNSNMIVGSSTDSQSQQTLLSDVNNNGNTSITDILTSALKGSDVSAALNDATLEEHHTIVTTNKIVSHAIESHGDNGMRNNGTTTGDGQNHDMITTTDLNIKIETTTEMDTTTTSTEDILSAIAMATDENKKGLVDTNNMITTESKFGLA